MMLVSLAALLCLAAQTAAVDNAGVARILKGVEQRYNASRTLEVAFEQTTRGGSQSRRVESGVLSLRKPGKMRWDYRAPEGKLFLSDGKHIYFYSPSARRAEKLKLSEADDLRAPLAFLLGRLDFSRDFRAFEWSAEGDDTRIKALPKSDRLPYSAVEFIVTSSRRIRWLSVLGRDQMVLEFRFDGEKLNPPLAASLFRFEIPPGSEFVDLTR